MSELSIEENRKLKKSIMKKIMFNEKYGLTSAVLQGRKTMTRRIVTGMDNLEEGNFCYMKPPYKVGEVVAVAMAYKGFYGDVKEPLRTELVDSAGFFNKMFVKADLMPHRIRITDRKIERLHDISDEDCLLEGVFQWGDPFHEDRVEDFGFVGATRHYDTPREAFTALIDKVSGRGTWDSNPWVFAYSFELVK